MPPEADTTNDTVAANPGSEDQQQADNQAEDKGGQEPPSLRAQLAERYPDEDARNDFVSWANRYTTDDDFAKSVFEMQKGWHSRVPVPGKDAKEEDWNKYFQRVGKPKEASKYEFDFGKTDDGKPIELDDDDRGFFEAYKEHSFKNHKTQKQFEEDIRFFQDFQNKQAEAMKGKAKTARDGVIQQMKSEMGSDFETNVQAAVEGGILYAPSEDDWTKFVNRPMADGTLVGDDPVFIKTMAKIGRSSGEDQRVRNMRASGEAENIQAEIARLESEAYEKGSRTTQEPYHSQLTALYAKLQPKRFSGYGGSGHGTR